MYLRPVLVLTLASALLGPSLALAASADAAPFRTGKVAVYASPDQLPDQVVHKYLRHAGISVIKVEPGREWETVKRLRAQGRRAGVNRLAHASALPNDRYFPFQWNLESIQSRSAWDISNGSGVTVAVLDTGLALEGRDGIACVKPGYDMVNDDAEPHDDDGHGTHVSGTIAQATNNRTGVAGLAHGACVMPVKVLGDDGSGSFADIVDGIYFAVDHGADVINMSLGTNALFELASDPLMDPALDYAYRKGVTVVAAAGNEGHRRNVSYPAIYPSVIAVGATDARNELAPYSNRGEGLDLVAPGGNTGRDDNGDGYPDGIVQETLFRGGWRYPFLQGTSMASPHVAAAAALLIASGAASTPEQVLEALSSTARDLGDTGYDASYGHGLIQVYDALADGRAPAACIDADGDGYCVSDGDCNDNNPRFYPGANDTRGWAGRNQKDNDCDGTIDG